MRVLMLSQNYAPVIGGEERHVQNLAEHLARRGHDVHVATMSLTGHRLERRREGGVDVHRLSSLSARLPGIHAVRERPQALPMPDPVLARELATLTSALAPDVVHAHNWIVNSYLPVHRQAERPLLMSLHGYAHRCAVTRYMYRGATCSGPGLAKCAGCATRAYDRGKGPAVLAGTWLMKPWKESSISHFLPVSTAVAQGTGLTSSGVSFDVVPNFVPGALLDRDAADARPEHLPTDDYLLFVGDVTADKGALSLLSAYRQLPEPKPGLLIVGRMVEHLTSLPPGAVLASEWPHEHVVAAFQHAIGAVLPSEWPDPCPTTVLEAMALGSPLITTPVGGIVDMVDAASALIVAPGDVAALARAMQELLADPDGAAARAEVARRRAVRFTAATVVPEVEAIYQAAVRESAAPAGAAA